MTHFRSVAGFLLSIAGTALLLGAALADQDLPSPPIPPATRGPVRIAFTPGGDRALVSERDEHTFAVVDSTSGRVIRRIPTGGEQPAGLAVGPSGLAVVVNQFSGSVATLDLAQGIRRALVALRGEPSDVTLSRDAKRAFVSLSQLDTVAVLELPDLRVAARISVGRRPRAMALMPDGSTLLVANSQGGSVSLVDTTALRETRRIELTGVNLRGIGVTADGTRAYVTGQIPANARVTRDSLDIWTNTVFSLDLRPQAVSGSAEGWIDFTLGASPDPDGLVVLEKELVAVALSGADQALLVRAPGPHLRSYDPVIVRRVPVGARPRGMALTPDRRHLWVANEVGGTISVLEAGTLQPVRTISLGVPGRSDAALRGRYLFGNARLAAGRQFTCSSCHPDGGADGLAWDFVHVPDGLRARNTRSLRGGVAATAPFRWTGFNREIEEFIQEEVVGLLQGPKQDPRSVDSIRRFLEDLPMPPNPYRDESGDLTPAAARGQALFEGKAGCITCHDGPARGGAGRKACVGTTDADLPLDVPHLRGAYDTAPYLHDGRAGTLEQIFIRHNSEQKHGKAHLLSEEERADLLRYVREL
jgi:DNA-binding beta-propeller fold protein YncE